MSAEQIRGVDGLSARLEHGVAEIVIDRPSRRNAITLSMWHGLTDLFAELGARSDLRAIVLKGAGNDFSAGADISEFDSHRGDAKSARAYEAANSRAFSAVRNSAVPVIAAIRGICFGGGFGLAAASDLRVATPDATFSVPAARLGLAYPQDAMIDIVSSLGPQTARYLTFSGARIGAHEARECGFLLDIVGADGLDARAFEIAGTIADNAPLSVRASKLAIAAVLDRSADATSLAQAAGDVTFESSDYAEGRSAFRERRTPRFSGS